MKTLVCPSCGGRAVCLIGRSAPWETDRDPEVCAACFDQEDLARDSFPVGTRVELANGAGGLPGVVVAVKRGRVHVNWSDLNYTGKHQPHTLRVADTEQSERRTHV